MVHWMPLLFPVFHSREINWLMDWLASGLRDGWLLPAHRSVRPLFFFFFFFSFFAVMGAFHISLLLPTWKQFCKVNTVRALSKTWFHPSPLWNCLKIYHNNNDNYLKLFCHFFFVVELIVYFQTWKHAKFVQPKELLLPHSGTTLMQENYTTEP